jgi:hypothetical protein
MNNVRTNLYRLDGPECNASTASAVCECAPIHARDAAARALVVQLLKLPLRHGESASGCWLDRPHKARAVVLRRALHVLRLRVWCGATARGRAARRRAHGRAECHRCDCRLNSVWRLMSAPGTARLRCKLQAIAEHLKRTGKDLLCMFVLHDYDRFADRSQQTLLYNLYDFAQLGRARRRARRHGALRLARAAREAHSVAQRFATDRSHRLSR